MKGGFMFKINDKQIERWNIGRDTRVCPDGGGVDCGAMILSFLGLPPQISEILQRQANYQEGLSPEQLIAGLNELPKEEFTNVPTDIYPFNFDNIPNLVEFLYNNLPKSHAIIALCRRSEGLGHFILFAKDKRNQLYIIDPQNDLIINENEKVMVEYLGNFQDIVLILAKGCGYTRLDLYKDGEDFQVFRSFRGRVFGKIKKIKKRKTKKQNKRKSSKKGRKNKNKKSKKQ